MIINLNGEWIFNIKGTKETINAIVPSSNYEILLNSKKIDDPFLLDNEEKSLVVTKNDYIYKKVVDISSDILKEDRVYLCLNQIDTIATLFINGVKIYSFNDCHINYEIDIKDKLIVGSNIFEIDFESPTEYVNKKYNELKTPINSNGQNGISHIRKPACHFGWDWGPVIPISGITGDIYIKTYKTAKIEDVKIEQKHLNDKVELIISSKIDGFNNKDILVKYSVVCPDGTVVGSKAKIDNDKYVASILINNPKLWWTKELSDVDTQPLYEVNTILLSNGEEIDRDIKNIGLRTLYLDRSVDKFGKNFCFVLNGVRIFAKGANFIPPDSLINRYKEEDYDKLIETILFSNMNIIRVWGGGYIGNQYLYNKCDEKGILIWQDFPYACMGYPFFKEDFKSLCLNEASIIVKNTRHHASLALYSGNNEIEQMSGLWVNMPKYIKSQKEFFYNDLKDVVSSLSEISYIEGTPCGDSYLTHVNSDKIYDTHIWAVWHGLKDYKYFRKRPTRFCSEFGFESFPCERTIRKFNGDETLDFSSKFIQSHQKCDSGNEKIKYYISKRFNLPKTFKEYIYLSQICQSECVRYGAEFWRQNKGKCNGAIYWQLNDCWPVSSWSAIDYYNNYKALVYSSRKFYNPISISILDKKSKLSIYAINDLIDDKCAQIEVKVLDFRGKSIYSVFRSEFISANSSNKVIDIKLSKLKKFDSSLSLVLVAKLIIDGKVISSSSILLNKEKRIKLLDPKITKDVQIINDELVVTLKAKNYAHFVYVENLLCSSNFSDNYFCMMPGETKVIKQKFDKNNNNEELINSIKIFSSYNLSKCSIIKDIFERLKVILKPINFINYLFNR